MKKNTLLYILVVFLLVMNGYFMYEIFVDKRPKGPNPGKFLAKELQFDAAQMEAFSEMNDQHHEDMMAIMRDVRRLKDELFDYISLPTYDEEKVRQLTAEIGEKTRLRDEKTFYHFKEVQKICTDEQRTRFNELIKEALRPGRRRGGRPPGPPPMK
jgi:Spy/CpxP family protein refolding chaperone